MAVTELSKCRSAALSRSTIKIDSFQGFADLWSQTRLAWPWSCLFVLPFWLENVWRHLGTAGEPHIVTIYDGPDPIGSMPLSIEGTNATFLGSHEVCDYQDLISAPGRQQQVLEAVLAHLAAQGIRWLDLRTLRPDALLLSALASISPLPAAHAIHPEEMTFEIELPDSWEGYFLQLDGKQRHEVRRKLRRLESQGRVGYRCIDSCERLETAVEIFLTLFQSNRPDKAAFMTEPMQAYFRALMRRLAERRMLRLCFLDINDQPVAGVLCFDYQGTRYLYNSGYDERFESLSVGALSKALSMRNAIEAGCGRFDFLKGAEVYKRRLGGRQTGLYRCMLEL
jgi:CelD/BcsL family acetyltransferase involved in cellulose biosynthesis